jgi:jumonji domain-containing protein 7
MKFPDVMDYFEGKTNSTGVMYVQHQNGNFHTEFSKLQGDVDEEIGWVSASIGSKPDVVNIWIGNDNAVSSLHKDPYENFYAVVKGQKIFTLLPPT